MKYGILLIAALAGFGSEPASSQDAQAPAPPPPPEVEGEAPSMPNTPAPPKKVKLDHCGPQSAKVCDGIENISDLGVESWKIGAMGAALCSRSAAIESSRKRRKDRLEYEERLAEIAEDNDDEYDPWKPTENNTEFARRTNAECASNKDYWCGEMQLAAAEIADADVQISALQLVETACKPPQ